LAAALVLTFSVTGHAADQNQSTDIPVLFEATPGQIFPVYAVKDGKYYQVVKLQNSAPFFRVSATEWHYVDGDQTRDVLTSSNETPAYPVVYVKGENTSPIALPKGHSESDANTLLAGHGEYRDQLVCWGRSWGYYRASYYYYPRYSYYPTYYYYPRYYYPSYSGCYGGCYQPYYYGYGVPTYYSGYGCVINNSWW
jgi:hypothetical protein